MAKTMPFHLNDAAEMIQLKQRAKKPEARSALVGRKKPQYAGLRMDQKQFFNGPGRSTVSTPT